jgi:tRNA(His) 5'-end guanylyltransferase
LDYQTLDTSAWFDYEIQKIASISASMATMFFNRRFAENVAKFKEFIGNTPAKDVTDAELLAIRAYDKALKMGAMFDSRVFNIPKEEVCNLVYWRQQDATRNSIQMVGRAYFSHKELQNKNTSNIQDMLHDKFNVNWNNYPIACKRGSACIKGTDGKWFVDLKMPILKDKDRKYVDDLIYIGET